jgi:hypothetical protein
MECMARHLFRVANERSAAAFANTQALAVGRMLHRAHLEAQRCSQGDAEEVTGLAAGSELLAWAQQQDAR